MGKKISYWNLGEEIDVDIHFTIYRVQHEPSMYQAILKLANRIVPDEEKQKKILARVEDIVGLSREEPHIIHYIGWGFYEDKLFLVLDPMNGITLRKQYQERKPECLSTVLAYLQQLKEALEKAHRRKIYHLNLCPENIWLKLSGDGNEPELILDGWKIGVEKNDPFPYPLEACPYLPPESDHQEELGPIGAASDVYQAALLTCELLTGHLPFTFTLDTPLAEIRAQHATEEPVLEGIHPALHPVLHKALAKRVRDRYQDIGGFVRAFEQACETIPIDDPPPPSPPTWMQILSSLVPSIWSAMSHWPERVTPPASVGRDQHRRRRLSRRTLFKVGIAVIIATVAGGAVYEEWSRTRVGALVRQFTGHKDQVSAAVWSPGGDLIASGDKSGRIYVWDANTGSILQEFARHTGPIAALAWGPDGKIIASVDTGGQLFLWEVRSGDLLVRNNQLTAIRLSGGETRTMVWTPGGEHLVVNAGELVYVFDDPRTNGFMSEDPPAFDAKAGDVNVLALSSDGQRVVAGYEDCRAVVLGVEDVHRQSHTVYGYYSSDGEVRALSWSPSGNVIASSTDATVQLWSAVKTATISIGEGVPPFTLGGHSKVVNSIAFSQDGQRVASAGDDQCVLIYDLATNAQGSFTAHTAPINSLAWSPYPRDKYILTASDDTTVCIWIAS